MCFFVNMGYKLLLVTLLISPWVLSAPQDNRREMDERFEQLFGPRPISDRQGPNPNLLSVNEEERRRMTELFASVRDREKANSHNKSTEFSLDPDTSGSGIVKRPDGLFECKTPNNESGVCVHHYQCDMVTKTVITDGSTLLDFRQNNKSCPGLLNVCCKLGNEDLNATAPSIPPPPPTIPTPTPTIPPQTPTMPTPPITVTTRPIARTPPPVGPSHNTSLASANPQRRGCGYSNPGAADILRIFQGQLPTPGPPVPQADFGEYPWMIALLNRTEPDAVWSEDDYIGGGSLIHPSVVLTAAHKVYRRKAVTLKCRAGEWDTQTEQELAPHQERNVKKFVRHSDFDIVSVYNSIALLFLESPFDLSNVPHIGLACIGKQLPTAGTVCQTMGWGRLFHLHSQQAVVLKKVEVPLVGRQQCTNMLRRTRLGSFFELHPSLICAGGQAGQDSCTKDGGAPLVCPIGDYVPKSTNNRFAVYGMVAYGLSCGKVNEPGVYVHVTHFYDWIDQQMAAEGFPTDTYKY